MWFIYILLCQDDSFYTGITIDVEKRFTDHCAGQGARYTRSHPPVKIVYSESQLTRSAALKREAEIKRWSRAKKITELGLEILR